MLCNRRDCHKRPHMLNNALTRLKKWSTDMKGYFSYNSIHRCQSGSSAAEIQRCYSVPIQSRPPGLPFARQGEVFYLCLNRFLLFPSPLHLYAPAAILIQHVSRLCYLKCLFSLGLTKKEEERETGTFSPLGECMACVSHRDQLSPLVFTHVSLSACRSVSKQLCAHLRARVPTCFWVYLWECVSVPYGPWPRWLWVIAPYLVACHFLSLWLREGSQGAIYSTYLCPPLSPF